MPGVSTCSFTLRYLYKDTFLRDLLDEQGGEMQPIATITPKALSQLKDELSAPGGEGKSVRLVFEGFG